MKLILFILFSFILFSTFGQTITVKEYNQNGDPIPITNSQRDVVLGETISLEISILESAIDDFSNTPYDVGGTDIHRGLEIKSPPNEPIFEIIETYNETSFEVIYLLGKDIDGINSTLIDDDSGADYYRAFSTFVSDSQDHIDSITFKYVHIAIPCDLAPGSYEITLNEIDDFVGNASFTEDTILTLTYTEPEVSIDIPEPEIRDACYSNTVNLDVIIEEGGSDCAQYTLFVNNQNEGQFNDTINYAFSYGDWVKVQILGGQEFSDSIQIDGDYFMPLELNSKTHTNNTVLCPNEKVSFDIGVGLCTPNSITLYKEGTPDVIIGNPENASFDFSFEEACTVYAKLVYSVSGDDVEVQTSTFTISEILGAGLEYDFLDTYAFPVVDSGVNLMNLEYNETAPYVLPFENREVGTVPLKLGKDSASNYKVYRQPSVSEYLFYRFDIPYDSYPANTISDSIEFYKAGIEKGDGIPNIVTLYYGKYYETQGKYCYDSTSTAVYVIRDDVFIPQSAFCSNDDEEYTIEINTDLTNYQNTLFLEDTTVYSDVTYAGYNILVSGSYDETHVINADNSGHVINLIPSLWDTIGSEFEIVAKAKIELIQVTSSDCPQQWYKYGSYNEGQKVYYNGRVYKALQYISGSGLIIHPHDPVEIQSNDNEVRAPVPIGDPIVIYITPGVHTEYWEDVGTCNLGATTSMFVEAGYANNTFDIINPAKDGKFLDFQINYCRSNKEIELESNYTILDIVGGGGAITEDDEGVWKFIPEKMLPVGDIATSSEITLYYEDLYGCAEDTTYTVNVNENYKVKRNVQLSLDNIYCKTDRVFNLTCNYGIDSIYGPGVGDTVIPFVFTPDSAIDESIDSADINIYFEYRDNNQCWNDTTFNITIDKEYNVRKDAELNLDNLYCPVNDSIKVESNYSIISLSGEGLIEEDDIYTFNPFLALSDLDSLMVNMELEYRDKGRCLYNKTFNIEVNRNKLVDQSGFIENLWDEYCHVSVDYPISINDDDFEVDYITGYGILHADDQYFYNAATALDSLGFEAFVDTVILKYFDDNGCPYTKIKLINIDSSNVDATADLLIDSQYCAVNRYIKVDNSKPLHILDSIKAYGAILDTTDTTCYFNPFSVYENTGTDTMVIYSETVITDQVSAYFKDEKQCPYKKEYDVDISGSFAYNLNGTLVTSTNEYCQFDLKSSLVGNPVIDTLIGPGLFFDAENDQWYLDPAHDDFTTAEDDVDTSLTYYYRDNFGCPWYSDYEFVVWARPEPDFTFFELCEGDTTQITDITNLDGEGVINTWEWTFGDNTQLFLVGEGNYPIAEENTFGTYAAPRHIYPGPDKWPLKLRVKSDKGCQNQITDTVIIGGYPNVDFTFDGLLSTFNTWFYNPSTAKPFDPIVKCIWNWGQNEGTDTLSGCDNIFHKYNTYGVRNVKLNVITNNGCEDSVIKKVPIFKYKIVTSDDIYDQSFDSANNGWLEAAEFVPDMNSGWEREEVSGNLQTFPINDGFIWRTGEAADEIYGEDSWIESPGFDISQLDFPVLSIDIYQSVERGRDGAVVQYTLDDGDNWIVLDDQIQSVEEGINWYNEDNIIGNPGNQIITDKVGWSVNLSQWQTARFPLDRVKQQAIDSNAIAVRFRVAYASDEGNDSTIYDGFAFDNFRLSSRSRIVLFEQFVNTDADYALARQKERWLDGFLSANPMEAVGINYHNYIADDYDPLYYLNTPDISARSMEYGAYLEQLTMVDGLHRCVEATGDEAEAYYRMRSLKDKKFDIEVETSFVDGALQVSGTVTKLVDTLIHTEGTEKSVVRIGIVQKEMVVDDTVFKNVMVELLPVGIGNVVRTISADLDNQDTVQFSETWYPDNVTTIGQEYRLVVYVQGIWGVDEVHQVWFEDLDQSLIPQVDMSLVNTTNDEEGEDSFGNESQDQLSILQRLRIYPMPASGNFYLDWGQALEFDVNWKMTSIAGQTILNGKVAKGSRKHLIEAENIPTGVYLILLQDDDLKYLEKRLVVIN